MIHLCKLAHEFSLAVDVLTEPQVTRECAILTTDAAINIYAKLLAQHVFNSPSVSSGARGSVVGQGTMLQAGR
jgi:hypothetical protein